MNFAFIYPGQGAQYPQMAKVYFETFEIFKHTLEEAEDVLELSLKKILFEMSEQDLGRTFNSQLALFVSSCGIQRVVEKQFPNLKPSFVAGLSLGEYSALYASQTLSFKDALKLVHVRAKEMTKACKENKGALAVVLGLGKDILFQGIKELNIPNEIWIANLNCPGQVVLSGSVKGVEAAVKMAKDLGAKKVVMPITEGAFHSGLMQGAQNGLREQIEDSSFSMPKTPLIMNVCAKEAKDLTELKENLISQVSSTTYWEDSIRHLLDKGVNQFVEVGVGKILTGLNRRIDKSIKTVNLDHAKALEELCAWQDSINA
ncbi:Malonyl CoA-acyl carrier protein transacylase [Chlamydiales bacterium SCGC AB-751-O23]|nr:Malonyl CoA-acyl carrier protein transacylase [Chlamydiales bacterium SCGC AB-751-O23]